MKSWYFSFLSYVLAVSILLFPACTNSNGNTGGGPAQSDMEFPELLKRSTAFGSNEEADHIANTYNKKVAAIKKDPEDYQAYIDLATVYFTEGRITRNLGYYNEAAIRLLDKVIAAKPANRDLEFQALSYKSAVLLSMHQFRQAEEMARQALAITDKNAGVFGDMVDASVELGKYEDAIKLCDRMIAIRPDLRSYSRVSYLRQIHGDNRGAIEAMTLAVKAGMIGAEDTEWARVTLGDLYFNSGHPDTAAMLYQSSLDARPDYIFALIGQAKLEKAKKNYDAAIQLCERAIRIAPESSFITLMADCYYLKGDKEKANEIYKDVRDLLMEAEKEQNKADARVKHNGNRELAQAEIKAGDLDKALEYAKTDLAMRPANIDANELVAWIYYLKGDYTNAKTHADAMLATKVKNANTLHLAGLIYSKAGDAAKGKEYLSQAQGVSPYVDPMIEELKG